MPAAPRYLVIVRRGETGVLATLEQAFEISDGLVRVVWDRRTHERRVIVREVAVERRRAQRRAARPDEIWTRFGFAVVAVSGPA